MVWPITYPEGYQPTGSWYEENFKYDFDKFDGEGGAEAAYPELLDRYNGVEPEVYGYADRFEFEEDIKDGTIPQEALPDGTKERMTGDVLVEDRDDDRDEK